MNNVLAEILIGVVAAFHVSFLILDMFLWESSFAKRLFKMSDEEVYYTTLMAKHQGLYNGFLAAGLIWSFFIKDLEWQFAIRVFFLSCVSIAGIYSAYNTKKAFIFFFQALPAMIALFFICYR